MPETETIYVNRFTSFVLALFFSLFLAVSLFSAGFAVCTLAPTTELLSRLFSNFEQSAYLPEDTVELAVATRNFTVRPQALGSEAATATLAHSILDAAAHSSAKASSKASQWENITVPAENKGTVGMYALANQGAQYSLGTEEISHLIDCNKLINRIVPILVVIAVITVVLCVVLATRRGSYALARSLIAGPAVLLAAMIAIAIWGAVDFHGFFGVFHNVLFPQGNWTFPVDSLLICMLPTSFWIAMLFVWIFITVGLSVISVLVGRFLLRR